MWKPEAHPAGVMLVPLCGAAEVTADGGDGRVPTRTAWDVRSGIAHRRRLASRSDCARRPLIYPTVAMDVGHGVDVPFATGGPLTRAVAQVQQGRPSAG